MIYYVGNEGLVPSGFEYCTIEQCLEWLETLESVAIDTETSGMFNHSNKILMLQLSNGKTSCVIDIRTYPISLFKALENKLCIGQNIKFDYKFFKMHGLQLNYVYDTLLAECVLTTGLKVRELGLEAICMKYTGKQLDKSTRNQFIGLQGQPFTDKQILYGAEDVLYLHEIRYKQSLKAEELGLTKVIELENQVTIVFGDIEYNGMKLDPVKWLNLAKESESKTPEYINTLDNLVKSDSRLSKHVLAKVQGNLFAEVEEGYNHSRSVNVEWSSPTQVLKVLKSLKLPIESSNEKEIAKYQSDYPLVKALIDYKKNQKLVTTYGVEFINNINKQTHRVHTSFWQVQSTGRVSSGNKKESQCPNMQNLPADNRFRNCFIPEEGYKIVSGDYAGQELIVLAFISQEPVWIKALNEKKDLHSEVASAVFQIDITKVREKPDFLRGKSYRDVAKTVSFGLSFGMSKFKLSKTLQITVEEADTIINTYFANLPKLREYLETAALIGKTQLKISTCKPYSRIRFFDPHNGDFKRIGEIERESKNLPIQGTAADMIKLAMINCNNYIKANKLQDIVKIIMNVHDAIDCEVKIEFAEEWSKIQKRIMEESGSTIITGIPIIADMNISDCWSK